MTSGETTNFIVYECTKRQIADSPRGTFVLASGRHLIFAWQGNQSSLLRTISGFFLKMMKIISINATN